ncbi:glycosyl hydrolase catalytic core-domain-containing protein [Favolaschia claudopus]|uniref:Glycosyl hydrolase catalytic core-domain-containing protein n=1 Tax=Favolaschia claudopus TaxID=2862362 RepID=A0AAW0CGR3_9AGAR
MYLKLPSLIPRPYFGYYNWNFLVSDDASGLPVEFVPMLWGQAQADEFSDTIVSTLQSTDATAILGMNDPAPSGAPGSWQWLTAFLQQCGEECTVDFLVLHWYGTNATAFKEFLVDYHSRFSMNIWLTEWACQNMAGPGDQCSMSNVSRVHGMDNTDWIERYAWYGSKTPDAMHGVNPVGFTLKNAMMNSSGVINAL